MKLTFSLTDDQGNEYRGTAVLTRVVKQHHSPKVGKQPETAAEPDLSFDANTRAFMKMHAASRSGPEKFTLLLARLAKGKPAHSVSGSEIVNTWNKMTSILGKFNPAYSTRAKDNGWVDAPKHGSYVLTTQWKAVLRG